MSKKKRTKNSISAKGSSGTKVNKKQADAVQKRKRFELNIKQRTWLVCTIIFAFVMYFQTKPLYPFGELIFGHDFEYHYLRTEALAYKIREGGLFTGGIDYLFNNGAGYASSAAYPEIMLFIPAMLRVMGVGIGNSMAVFMIICSLLTYFTMFFCVKKITGSPVCASLGCAMFMLTFYRMDNFYTRFALGEVQAFIFWPLIIYGIYDLINDEFKKPYILSIGYIGMLMTHTISTIIAVAVNIILVLVYLKKLIKTPKKLTKLVVTAVITVALTSFYWIPLFELLTSCEMTFSHPYALSENFQIPFYTVFRDVTIDGLGILIFLFQLPRLMLFRGSKIRETAENENNNFSTILKFADICLAISLVFCFLVTDAAPWSVLRHILNFMQFPWRLYGAVTVMLSFSSAVYIFSTLKFADIHEIGIIIISIAVCFNIASHTENAGYLKYYNVDSNYYEDSEHTFGMGYGEWLPWTAKCAMNEHWDDFRIKTKFIYTDRGRTIEGLKSDGYISFDVPEEGSSYIDVPLIWYKGYKASDSDGNELPVSMSDMGFVRVDTSSASGSVEVAYKISSVTVSAYVISAVSAAGVLLFLIIKLKRKRS